MTPTKILLINLPSPPGMIFDRDSQGGFSVVSPSTRKAYAGGMNIAIHTRRFTTARYLNFQRSEMIQ